MSQEQQQENKQKIRIGLIFGGRSGEHEVSLASANAVMANLDKDKYEVIPIGITKTGAWLLGTEPTQLLAAPDAQPDSTQSNQQATTAVTLTGDPNVRRLIPLQNGAQLHDNGALDVIFPVMHGTYGEDGALQGLLEMANVPYVGCGEHFTSPSVVFPNIRDIFLVIVAFLQSIAKFIAWRPDVVFAKGGFVSVPAGIAARLFNIPLVIHDSDSHPGLANRILARFATLIATGAPLNNYPYNRKLAHYTGIPISEDFHPYTDEERQEMKAALGFESSKPFVVITGGGLGAGHLNEAVAKRLEPLLELASIMLLSGTAHYDEMRAFTPQDDSRFQLLPFINSEKMAQSLGAADSVVSRAGATTILELSALAKPTILIPNAQLAAGHQLKNAAEYSKDGAAEVIEDEELTANPQLLVDMIGSLLANPAKRKQMAKVFHALSKPNAAKVREVHPLPQH